MSDVLIIAGTSIIGALLLDLQRRLSAFTRAIAGMVALCLGAAGFLGRDVDSMAQSWFALSTAMLLLGAALLLPVIFAPIRNRA